MMQKTYGKTNKKISGILNYSSPKEIIHTKLYLVKTFK